MIFKFGTFEFDDQGSELRKGGRAVAIEPQPARALGLLLSRAAADADAVVSREELRDAVWGKDIHVDFERGLAYCISQVRSALGDSGENPRFVQTIPKRGFKFIAPVSAASMPRSTPAAGVLQFPPPYSPNYLPRSRPTAVMAIIGVVLMVALIWAQYVTGPLSERPSSPSAVIGASIFDNETGVADYDRQVAGLSDLVVEHLTKLDPTRIAVVGNAAILRQPRNIRNLQAVQKSLKVDYVLLGQLQRGESGLRFITHFIRLSDEKHLRANRLDVADPTLAGLEAAVVQEFDRAVREHVLNRSSN